MKQKFNTRSFTILALLTAILMVFSFTPLGTIPIGPLSITLNIIPIAVAAIALGPVGGLIIGSIFGLLSFLQCLSIGVPSGMGIILFGINPVLAFIQRFVPRALDGLLVGLTYDFLKKQFAGKGNIRVSSSVFGIVAGILLGLLGIGVGLTGINKNAAAKAAENTHPGTVFIIFGAAVLILGAALAYYFITAKEKHESIEVMPACFIAGFLSAFLNTLFFMSALVLLFGRTEYVQGLVDGRNFFVFLIAFVGINALVEMVVSTIITGLVGTSLHSAKVLPLNKKS